MGIVPPFVGSNGEFDRLNYILWNKPMKSENQTILRAKKQLGF